MSVASLYACWVLPTFTSGCSGLLLHDEKIQRVGLILVLPVKVGGCENVRRHVLGLAVV